ncbi:SRPBCC family protein, partial [Streptomyces sp. NPDC058459]|uniref:SRPBCC family protein n=1 Tax=Streptomyces sp. NPDC058459 TaxID=3346508 RepID=UPI00364D8780
MSDSIVVDVPPEAAYRAVSDPGGMGRWSPENLGTAPGSAEGPAGMGTSFIGRNKRGRFRRVTRCTVTA